MGRAPRRARRRGRKTTSDACARAPATGDAWRRCLHVQWLYGRRHEVSFSTQVLRTQNASTSELPCFVGDALIWLELGGLGRLAEDFGEVVEANHLLLEQPLGERRQRLLVLAQQADRALVRRVD